MSYLEMLSLFLPRDNNNQNNEDVKLTMRNEIIVQIFNIVVIVHIICSWGHKHLIKEEYNKKIYKKWRLSLKQLFLEHNSK